jgi:hypothetical protein
MDAPYRGLGGGGRNWRRSVVRVDPFVERQTNTCPESCKSAIGHGEAGTSDAGGGGARADAGHE